jgi:hypothetical protein
MPMLMTYMARGVAVAAALSSHISVQASEENYEHFVARQLQPNLSAWLPTQTSMHPMTAHAYSMKRVSTALENTLF